MPLIFVYITNPSLKVARKVGRYLIDNELAACINIFPIQSIYPWKGKIVQEKEFVLIAKTDNKHYAKIVKEIEKIHPYTVPCTTKIPVKANKKYEKWLRSCLKT